MEVMEKEANEATTEKPAEDENEISAKIEESEDSSTTLAPKNPRSKRMSAFARLAHG